MTNLNVIDIVQGHYGESFYIFNMEKLRKNYTEMFKAFSNRYSNIIIGYSYKTNYLPSLIKEMSELGAHAEVVSKMEYELALKIGHKSNEIIYNGPLKAYEDISIALEGNSIINLDSFYEIEMVEKYVAENFHRQYKVGLRVNFDMSIDEVSPLQSGYKQSRFGFCVRNGNFEKALDRLSRFPNLAVVGLHGHFSTSTRSLSVFKKITQNLCNLGKKYLSNTLEYIDVGGGFYGNVPVEMNLQDVPSYEDYAETICSIVNDEKLYFKNAPLLIIEPGLSLVVDTFKFYSKVIDVKQNLDEYFVLVNGSVHNIKPKLHKKNMPMKLVKEKNGNYKNETFNVVGITCMENDYLAIDYIGELPKPGDFLSFSNVGAYTIVLDPPFIKERPPIYAWNGEDYTVVRKVEKLDDFINENLYVF
ncbi:type III PLP-dependent enzyme domain-containing protein [Sporosarcina sp. CAU 1771]